MRDFHFPGRSPVYACDGMAATSHPLATQAAIETLRAGGTAADAAVTAVATLAVVEPHMTGIGGDCFCLVSKPGAPVWSYNGSGRSAASAGSKDLEGQSGRTVSTDSIHAVTVPGAVEAWDAVLKAYGRFELDRALAPAIRYAAEGFPVAPRVAFDWARDVGRLARDPGASRHFLPDGRAPAAGEVMKFPALAETLRAIAKHGSRAFYEGPIADDIAATVRAKGGVLNAEDLAAHLGNAMDTVAANYRGLDVVELPPNTHGMTALVLLNMLEGFDFTKLEALGADRLHIMIEACRIAYAVRDTHVSDQDHMRTSVASLLDKAFARRLAQGIDLSRRKPLPPAPTPESHTVYLTVVDRDRMAVSLINSLYSAFGVAVATEKTGILLQNRGGCFVCEPGHPNSYGPRKRPLHTIIPGMAMRDGRCTLSFGVMGGHYQAMGHAHVISNMVDYGMDVQEAIDAPRLFFEDEDVVVEKAIPPASAKALRQRGHSVITRPLPLGGGQGIVIDWERGVLIGGSDARKDGCALGY
jgi:gamma-glutamyltranspeptidase/glutathione hydrolase